MTTQRRDVCYAPFPSFLGHPTHTKTEFFSKTHDIQMAFSLAVSSSDLTIVEAINNIETEACRKELLLFESK